MINNPILGTPIRNQSARLITMLIQVLLASLVALKLCDNSNRSSDYLEFPMICSYMLDMSHSTVHNIVIQWIMCCSLTY